MSVTPSVWLSAIETTDPDLSFSNTPVVVGLSNGNTLVVWNERNELIAPAPDSDVVGVIYDAQGNDISGPILLNAGVAQNGSEGYVTAAATADGGFVIAYEHSALIGTDSDILFSRFDAAGTRTQASYIENDSNDPNVYFWEPSITARTDGTFFVSYQAHDNNNDSSIWGRIIDANGVVGPVLNVEIDGSTTTIEDNYNTSVSATLTDGTVVTVFIESGDITDDLLMSSVNTDGTLGFNNYLASFTDAESRSNPDIAPLSDGRFVIVYTRTGGEIEVGIWPADGGIEEESFIISGSSGSDANPSVIGLPDGGFYVAFQDNSDSQIYGQRYDAAGASVGFVRSIANDGANVDLSLTSDGRIAVTYIDVLTSTPNLVLLDPRDDSFTLETSGAAATRLEGGTVFGSAGDDTIYGQDGRDTIYGLTGEDTLYGGGNRDYLGGSAGDDMMFGGHGNDVFVVGSAGDQVIERAGQGEDTVRSSITYTLNIELEHLNLLGNSNISGHGNNKDNILQGNNGHNQLSGYKGDDLIKGFDGRDGLVGNDGADRLFGMQGNDVLRGDLGADELNGGAGNDRFVFRAASDSKVNASQRDTIKDFVRGADKIDLRQIDASADIGGDQGFEFIGGTGFDGDGGVGQVRFNAAPTGVMVAIDTDGDGRGDMLILVEGVSSLSANDFLL